MAKIFHKQIAEEFINTNNSGSIDLLNKPVSN